MTPSVAKFAYSDEVNTLMEMLASSIVGLAVLVSFISPTSRSCEFSVPNMRCAHVVGIAPALATLTYGGLAVMASLKENFRLWRKIKHEGGGRSFRHCEFFEIRCDTEEHKVGNVQLPAVSMLRQAISS